MEGVTEYGYVCNLCNITPDWVHLPEPTMWEVEVEDPQSGDTMFFTKADLERMLEAMEDAE